MTFHSWLRTLPTVFKPSGSNGRRGRTRYGQPTARFRPSLEVLEDRLSPALLTVTTTSDDPQHNGLSLRDAVYQASTDVATNVSDTSNFNIPNSDPGCNSTTGVFTITLSQGQIELSGANTTATITIDGGGTAFDGATPRITVDGNLATRIFQVDGTWEVGGAAAKVKVELDHLSLVNGMIPAGGPQDGPFGPGGAVFNGGDLTINNCILSHNFANDGTNGGPGLGGGAICNFGTLTIAGTTLSDNHAILGLGGGICDGGAIYNYGGTVTLSNSVLSNNSAYHDGGAISTCGSLTMTDCTVSGNTAGRNGGAIYVDPTTVTIISCTFTGNTASAGADLYNLSSTITLIGSSLSGIVSNGGTVTDPIADLIAQIGALNLNSGQRNSLTSTLQAAQQSLLRANNTSAVNQLNAFVNKVNALVNSHRLGEISADSLVSEADSLIDVIS
jgi:predicted outer membrane repeat protein